MRKCYLHATGDCGGGMSGEHILSRAVLKELGGVSVTLTSSRITLNLGLDSSAIKTNILCRRHNSALSPVDAEAARFVRTFKSLHQALLNNTSENRTSFYLFNGFDLERWLLKTMVSIFKSGHSNVRKPTYTLPLEMHRLFWTDNWQSTLGLYFRVSGDAGMARFTPQNVIDAALITTGSEVCGMKLSLYGLPFSLLAHNPYNRQDNHDLGMRRPSWLVFYRGKRVFVILLVWREQGGNILMSLGDDAALLPDGVTDVGGPESFEYPAPSNQ